jgi:hypothetical protein
MKSTTSVVVAVAAGAGLGALLWRLTSSPVTESHDSIGPVALSRASGQRTTVPTLDKFKRQYRVATTRTSAEVPVGPMLEVQEDTRELQATAWWTVFDQYGDVGAACAHEVSEPVDCWLTGSFTATNDTFTVDNWKVSDCWPKSTHHALTPAESHRLTGCLQSKLGPMKGSLLTINLANDRTSLEIRLSIDP